MSLLQSLLIWPDRALLSLLVLVLIAAPLFYAARGPMHALILSVTRAVSNPLRLSAHWLVKAAVRLHNRNREVLFAHGSHEVKQSIAREFERVAGLVERDLAGYPVLQRKLLDEITRIEEDFKESGEVPLPPPNWVQAVEAIAKIKPSGDGVIERLLGEIRDALGRASKKVVSEYRTAYRERHRILKGVLSFWRSVSQTLTQVDRSITGLQTSAAKIDANVVKLEKIAAKGNDAAHALVSSASTQFFVAAMVMVIAFGGGFVNYKLVSLPMSAMVGGGDYITDNLRASEVAALVIILFETLMGLFLMEALHFTNLFPFGNITGKMRRQLFWASLLILLVLASVEVSLAVMRDAIIGADVALKKQLGAVAGATHAESPWVTRIPTFGQMILGFTLPFALAFVAIPLESFINSGRTVIGVAMEMALQALAFVLRITAHITKEIGRFAVMFYDVLIFVPLAMERWVISGRDWWARRSQGAP
jgi:hypothetical protein